jgi:ketose-bisphosphate aldolase
MNVGTNELLQRAWRKKMIVPGFNIPYLPMLEPVVQALRDCNSFGLVMVARLEWMKFEARSLTAVAEEYHRVKDERYTRLHLDHVPVIDEDNLRVNYLPIIRNAISAGFQSVMIDGSRLSLANNIAATREVVELAHAAGVAVEGELGAVMGHEDGPTGSYEEIFASGKGFTDPSEAQQFVRQTGVDWLSVAIGSIHGAISNAFKDQKKVEARLNIPHLQRISEVVNIPMVLHGGTGIARRYILDAVQYGCIKINIGTALRQPFEQTRGASVVKAKQAVYDTTLSLLRNELDVTGSASVINP